MEENGKGNKKSSNVLTYLILGFLLIAGIGFIAYPTVANLWNRINSAKVIEDYDAAVQNLGEDETERMWEEALKYNMDYSGANGFVLKDDLLAQYDNVLNIDGNGLMGYIEIEKINVELPIYHGTSDAVLQVASGHLEWSSLPVGGKGTHCVLSGHRGLPGAKLFTDLDMLVEGDKFKIHILDELLTYQVDQIRIVVPTDVQDLCAEGDNDYCTLVTCTPYGVNTHRLLIRGHRIENDLVDMGSEVISEAVRIEPLIVTTVVAIPLMVLILVCVLVFGDKGYKKYKRREKDE